jgi:peroxiredoxin Q/BCP
MLKEGDKAPNFTGLNQDGETISLSDFKGKKVVLYFYPKDNTSGCTAEACNLNDNLDYWNAKNYAIIGVSRDSVASHKKFQEKYNFRFNLISDAERNIIDAYGVWGEQTRYGKTTMSLLRTTFVISEKGIIEKVISKVDTKNHTEQLIKTLELE